MSKKAKKVTKSHKKTLKHLPKEIIAFPNADKGFHESWKKEDDELNFPHPFRVVLTGRPNSGKTTVVKNILIRQNPPFEKLIIVYPDGHEGTHEYDDIEGDVVYENSIPSTDFFEAAGEGPKTLCIIDDFELKGLDKTQRASLDRLVGHCSTHRSVSVMLCSQDFYNVPPIARRCANVFVLWKPRDISSMNSVAARCGHDLGQLFKLCKTNKDSIWLDFTNKSPMPLRKNGYLRIQEELPEEQSEC